ncbi:hypothetical protein [Myxosarcina sp. GI1(2024)]
MFDNFEILASQATDEQLDGFIETLEREERLSPYDLSWLSCLRVERKERLQVAFAQSLDATTLSEEIRDVTIRIELDLATSSDVDWLCIVEDEWNSRYPLAAL